jgi:Flp pilus assembly CpaF family ATPase
MKVYLVQKSWGSYDDYGTRISKVFLDRTKANEYVEKYNKELENKKKQHRKCQDCRVHYGLDLDKIKKNCNIAHIIVNGDNYTYCKSEVNYYDSEDLHEATIIEMETEDDK